MHVDELLCEGISFFKLVQRLIDHSFRGEKTQTLDEDESFYRASLCEHVIK